MEWFSRERLNRGPRLAGGGTSLVAQLDGDDLRRAGRRAGPAREVPVSSSQGETRPIEWREMEGDGARLYHWMMMMMMMMIMMMMIIMMIPMNLKTVDHSLGGLP